MKQSFQKQYNDSIKLISHLILTKPKPVIGLLAKHGVIFKGTPPRKQIINEVVELLNSSNEKFENDLGKLLTVHIQYRGKEMLALERSEFSSYDDGDMDEDQFWGALAKGAIGIVGSLFKGKKRRRRSRGGGNAAAQAAQTKRDMQLLSIRMAESKRRREEERRRREEERRRREEAERRRREEEERRRREQQAAARRKQTNTMLMVGGGIALLAVVGVVISKSGSKQPLYPSPAPMQPIAQ